MVVFMVKKGIFVFVVLGLLCSVFYIISNETNDELRIRILANSNSENDLKDKEIVKDIVEDIINDNQTYDVNIIKEELQRRVPSSITKQIKVELTNSYYPAKSYNDNFIPSGSYKTILITIGEGKGHNFWTLLYPEYYHLEFEESNEIEYRSYFVDLIRKLLIN